jgi:hypothetical protein
MPFLISTAGVERRNMADARRWRADLDRALRTEDNTLELNYLSLGDTGALEVVEELRASQKHSVVNLYLANNGISDVGAAAVADLLRQQNCSRDGSEDIELELLGLGNNDIGRAGVAELAEAVSRNETLHTLFLHGNRGVDDDPGVAGSNPEEANAGTDSLVSAIGVNTTLKVVHVGMLNGHRGKIGKALSDTEGRLRGREKFLSGTMTKPARTTRD